MKLKEQIELLRGRNVKIGAGSGFIFVGKCDALTFKDIEKISKSYIGKYSKNYQVAKNEVENFDKVYKKSFIRSLERAFNEEGFGLENVCRFTNKWIENKPKELKKLKIRMARAKKRVDNFVHLPDRKVKEVYEGICKEENDEKGRPCMIVICEGHDEGKFWMIKEAKGKGKGK